MQIQWYPQPVCNFLDHSVRNFICNNNHMNMVSWNVITRPRKRGGLGVCIARNHNIALLGKLIWDLISNPNKLLISMSGMGTNGS